MLTDLDLVHHKETWSHKDYKTKKIQQCDKIKMVLLKQLCIQFGESKHNMYKKTNIQHQDRKLKALDIEYVQHLDMRNS